MLLGGRFSTSGLPRTAKILAVSAFIVALGFGVVLPVLTPFARTFNATSFQVGLVVSLFSGMRLITSPFASRIGRFMGERNAIVMGMLVVAVSTIGTAIAPTLEFMLLARTIGGFGSATFTIAAMNLLLATTPEHIRGRATGLYQGGFLMGSMFGPALGGLLGAISLQAPFWFYAAMLVASAVFTALTLPARAVALPASTTRAPARFRAIIRDVRYQAACVVAFGQGWMSFGVRGAMVPIFVTEALRLDTGWTGIAFAVAAFFQTAALMPVGTATDRRGRKPIMMLSGLICGVATLMIPLSNSIWPLIVLLSLYGIGAAMQGTAPTAAVGDATRGRGGLPVAVFTMTADLGAIIGPLASGVLLDTWDFDVVFIVAGIMLLFGTVAAAFIPRSLDREFLEPPRQAGRA